jgi:hypothetical protein
VGIHFAGVFTRLCFYPLLADAGGACVYFAAAPKALSILTAKEFLDMSLAKISRLVFFIAAAACLTPLESPQAASLKPEEVVAKHLDSVGTAQARATAKSRLVEATAQFKILMGGTALLDGTAKLASQERKLQLLISFDNNSYRGEQFICDGDKVEVAATMSQARSPFGEFVRAQDVIVREGLLTGALSTAWPLLNLEDRKPKLSFEGLKKIDGAELYDLQYHPKKSSGDLDIHLYFDPQTFRHLLTVYKLSHGSGLGASMIQSSQQKETRYEIKERFSDFKTSNALTLPTHEEMQYTQENQDGHTVIFQWTLVVSQVSENPALDPRNFAAK